VTPLFIAKTTCLFLLVGFDRDGFGLIQNFSFLDKTEDSEDKMKLLNEHDFFSFAVFTHVENNYKNNLRLLYFSTVRSAYWQ
jgi:hypothetical protein